MIVQAALSWIDTPYHHQARLKGVGVDCAQLVAAVAEECKLLAPGTVITDYSPEWHLHNREERMLGYLKEFGCFRIERAVPGSILCFQFGRVCSHLGILVNEHEFVHARIDAGRVVLNTLSGDWARRHVLTYSYPLEKYR